MVETGLGLKAATITPPGIGDIGSPNRILREGVNGSVIVRTGRRIPGVTPLAPVVHPIVVVRMAVGDAYGADESLSGTPGELTETASRTEHISRSICRAVADYSFVTVESVRGCVYGDPKWTVSPVYEGMLKEEMGAADARHPNVAYQPILIDATYAGLLTEAASHPRVIPPSTVTGLPARPRPRHVRLHRRRGISAPLPRRRTQPTRRHGRSAARNRSIPRRQERRQPDGYAPRLRRSPRPRRPTHTRRNPRRRTNPQRNTRRGTRRHPNHGPRRRSVDHPRRRRSSHPAAIAAVIDERAKAAAPDQADRPGSVRPIVSELPQRSEWDTPSNVARPRVRYDALSFDPGRGPRVWRRCNRWRCIPSGVFPGLARESLTKD